MRNGVALYALPTVAATSGCGTIGSYCSPDPEEGIQPYGGVALEAKTLKDSANRLGEGKPFVFDRLQVVRAACDLPLCAAADTVLLPFTIPIFLNNRFTEGMRKRSRGRPDE
jgi:uncharacterized protein YceK